MSESAADGVLEVKARFSDADWSAIDARVGWLLVSITDSVNVLLADITGEPLSVTVTVTLEDVPPKASPGVPVITPVVELIEAHDGSPVALKVSVLDGTSVSLALGVLEVNAVFSVADWSAIGASVGAEFTSFTLIVIVLMCDMLGEPLSVTFTSNV